MSKKYSRIFGKNSGFVMLHFGLQKSVSVSCEKKKVKVRKDVGGGRGRCLERIRFLIVVLTVFLIFAVFIFLS